MSRASVYRILQKKDKVVKTKLTNEQKLELIEDSQKSGFCIEDAKSKYSLSKSSVYRILQNKDKGVWTQLPVEYMKTTRTPNTPTLELEKQHLNQYETIQNPINSNDKQ